MLTFPKPPKGTAYKFADFQVGTRVRVARDFVDWQFFRCTETGTVIRNDGNYLGIIVRFDVPLRYTDGDVRYEHNFNPDDLAMIDDPMPGKPSTYTGVDPVEIESDTLPA